MKHDTVQIAVRASQTSRKIILAISCLLGISIFFIADSYWPDGGVVHESIEWVGIALISICVLGRTWCTLYIGNRKNYELIQDGPYSVVRHPLYLFSIVGAIGVGAQAGGFTAALVGGFLTWAVFLRMSQVEEDAMLDAFGALLHARQAESRPGPTSGRRSCSAMTRSGTRTRSSTSCTSRPSTTRPTTAWATSQV